jgi:hypothetical protein
LSSLWLHRLDPLRVLSWPGAKAALSVVVIFLLVKLEDAGLYLLKLPLGIGGHHQESLDLIFERLDGFFVFVDFNVAHGGLRRCSDINSVDSCGGECTWNFVEEIIPSSLVLNWIGMLQRSGSWHHLECTLVHRDVARADDGSAILHSDFEGLWIVGDEIIALIFEEGVAAAALHARGLRVSTVPAGLMLLPVLTL